MILIYLLNKNNFIKVFINGDWIGSLNVLENIK